MVFEFDWKYLSESHSIEVLKYVSGVSCGSHDILEFLVLAE
jgi:hypothetical protein